MRLFYLVVLVVFMSGCTKVGPDFKKEERVTFPQELQHTNETTQKELGTWWRMFGDKKLERLIEKAYENNLDIKQAGLRILQSRTLLGISQSFEYPQASTLSGNAITFYKNSQNVNNVGMNFDIGWEIDFWGKYARGIESARADLYLSVASYRDIMTTVVAEVARNYIEYRIAEERIVYAKRNIAIQERVVHMTEVQFNSGNVSELDMQQARTQLYTTRAKLPALELNKINALNALATLLGMNKDKVRKILGDPYRDDINAYIKQKVVAIELNEDQKAQMAVSIIPMASFNPNEKIDLALIKRRPDIQAAEFRARSASAKIGASEALLYPSFSLVGSIGVNATDITGSWTKFDNTLGVSAGPTFSWNVFQFGRIKNRIRFQDALFEEAMIGYNKALLGAINEVSNALNGYIYTKEQLKESEKALEATIRAFNLSVKQYNDGFVSYQRLLSTVEKLTFTQDVYAQIKGLVSINAVFLYKSLGGGWQYAKEKAYIDEKTKKRLQDSGVEWESYLDDVRLYDE